jgi:DNA-binding transcriptional ArsR family regulator
VLVTEIAGQTQVPVENIFDQRHVRALSHPLRVRILAILEEREASPLELARLLRAELGVIAYHVRKLNSLGFIRLVRQTRVRGALQRHYRAVERPRVSDAAWARTPPVVKQALVQATIQQITEYAAASAAAGGLDSADAHATRTALRLDRAGWRQLSLLLRGVLEEITVLEAETRARAAAGECEELEDVGVVLMLFKAVPFGRLAEAQAAGHSAHDVTAPSSH